MAALQILLDGLFTDEIKFLHTFLHLVHAATQKDQQGFDLLGRGSQLQDALLSNIEGLLNFLDAVGILRDQIAQLQTAER